MKNIKITKCFCLATQLTILLYKTNYLSNQRSFEKCALIFMNLIMTRSLGNVM